MQKTKNNATRVKIPVFKSLTGLCFAATLTAMSFILGKFLQIPNPFQDFIRISFENLPIFISAFTPGPIAAALVGVAADLIGCVLYGYSINPLITLGAGVLGFVAGFICTYIIRKKLILGVPIAVFAGHILGSVLIKSAGLAAWYLSKYSLGYWEFVAWRLLNYTLIGLCECVILYLLLKNRAFDKQIQKMIG
jgi:ECF transporter S component (folate family)